MTVFYESGNVGTCPSKDYVHFLTAATSGFVDGVKILVVWSQPQFQCGAVGGGYSAGDDSSLQCLLEGKSVWVWEINSTESNEGTYPWISAFLKIVIVSKSEHVISSFDEVILSLALRVATISWGSESTINSYFSST